MDMVVADTTVSEAAMNTMASTDVADEVIMAASTAAAKAEAGEALSIASKQGVERGVNADLP